MRKLSFIFFLFCVFTNVLHAQQPITQLKIVDTLSDLPIQGVSISIDKKSITQTDSTGIAIITKSGLYSITLSAIGYQSKTEFIKLPIAALLTIKLVREEKEMEEVTIVSSTRTNQNIEFAPIKVEVLGAEEMNEESTVKPATVLGIIGDISGVQIQQTSAVSGNANVRIQGLDGRYTQILRDGLPLYEGFSGGFGLMSIPPLDLKQVELIKGSASTLYGAGAIGGLVNMISKKPTATQEGIFTINNTTLKESNLDGFISKRFKKIGYTLFGGITNQSAVDVNKDGFSDVGRLSSIVVHPRLFIYPKENTTITIGFTKTMENRIGGDMQVIKNKQDTLHQFYEKNKINRNSGELLLEKNLGNKNKFQIKSSVSSFSRRVTTNLHNFNGKQLDYFSEASIVLNKEKHSFVGGLNFSGNAFNKLPSDSILLNNTSANTIGAFMQYGYKWGRNSSVELGLRNDYQSKYGNFILPRVAIFQQLDKHWGVRAGFGVGYKIPDALTPQIQDYAIQNILPIDEFAKPEKSYGYNAEINYKLSFGDENTLFINQAFFLTQLNNPLVPTQSFGGDLILFKNESKPIISKGFDTYAKLHCFGIDLYAGLTYTIAERKYLESNQFVPYTPKFRMAYMLTKEWEGKGRFCIESSYNGPQYRFDNTKSPGYLFFASMIEYKFNKHVSVILNGENLLDYRQSKSEKLFTGSISNPSFNTLWAPIDGRVINLCLKLNL
jgi:iron complex outermembrane receptor protein/outer membrane receptor for ferrienterochelin and colicins